VSDEATAATSNATVQGQALWQEVQRRVDELPEETLPVGMDGDLALGGICDLTSQCKVWFSERFDVDAEITRLRARREEAS
jgi:hypothetical protein